MHKTLHTQPLSLLKAGYEVKIKLQFFLSDLQYASSSEPHHQQSQQNLPVPVPSSSPPPVPVKKRNRKRKDPHQRKIKPAGTHIPREEIKRRRCRGDEYFTRTGKLIRKKVFQMIDCKCRRNCTAKVPKEVRKKIFEEYHAMADWNSQTQFIVASVVVTDVKRKRLRKAPGDETPDHVSRRASSRVFYLTNKKIQVCKTVFMSTLGITGKRVDYALRVKAIPMTAIATPDRRGKKQPKNKTPVEAEERIKAHINSFGSTALSGEGHSSSHRHPSSLSTSTPASFPQPMAWSTSTMAAQPPHSTPSLPPPTKPSNSGSKASTLTKHKGSGNGKSSATQLHLPSDLTITKMYQMYQDQCEQDNVPAASMWVYTKILHSDSKFRSMQQRQSHSSWQSTASSSSSTAAAAATASCQCCDMSYAILTSGEPPEKIVELLLEEHRRRLSHSSSSTSSSSSSQSATLSVTPLCTTKVTSKTKMASNIKTKPQTPMVADVKAWIGECRMQSACPPLDFLGNSLQPNLTDGECTSQLQKSNDPDLNLPNKHHGREMHPGLNLPNTHHVNEMPPV